MQLKTDEVDKALNITENMTNSLSELHFLPFFRMFLKKIFSKHSERLVPEKCAFG